MRTMKPGDSSRGEGTTGRCPLRRIAAIVVWIGLCLMLTQSMKTPERLIITGTHATITTQQPDQSVLSVGPDSMAE
jgi:hypothetical protein